MKTVKILLYLFLMTFSKNAFATIHFFTVHSNPWIVSTGETFNVNVTLWLENEPNQSGDFYTYIYPSWGGIHTNSLIHFNSSIDDFYVIDIPITAPNNSGNYSLRFDSFIEFDNEQTGQGSFEDDITVEEEVIDHNINDDLDVTDHNFDNDPYNINEEVCSDIKIRNYNDNYTYEIDTVKLYDRNVSVEWNDQTDTTDDTIDPDDWQWFGDPFCFIPLEEGRLQLDVKVQLEGDNTYYLIDHFHVDIIDPDPCTNINCNPICQNDTIAYQQCQNGQCINTSWTDCNLSDYWGNTIRYCSGTNLRQYVQYYNYYCTNGACQYSLESRNDQLVQACNFGCQSNQCNPDPCQNVICNDYCENNTLHQNRSCQNSQCNSGQTINCNTLDQISAFEIYCDGILLKRHQSKTNHSCLANPPRCESLPNTFINEEVIQQCTTSCQNNQCICLPIWQCNEWSECNLGSETRVCHDNNNCQNQHGKPNERRRCQNPCLIDDAYWSQAQAQDFDEIEMMVEYHGDCSGREISLLIYEQDFGLLRDDFNSRHVIILENNQGIAQATWQAVYTRDPSLFDNNPEFYFETTGADNEISSNLLTVTPKQIELGTVSEILSVVPPQNDPCPDYGMVTLSYECILEREAAKEQAEQQEQELINQIENFIDQSETIAVIIWTASCVGCIGGIGIGTIVAGACPETFGASCTLIPITIGLMRYLCPICLGEFEGYAAEIRPLIASQLRKILASRIIQNILIPFERNNQIQIIKRTETVNGARVVYQKGPNFIRQEVLYPPNNPSRPQVYKYINYPLEFSGGTNFLKFVSRFRQKRNNAEWAFVDKQGLNGKENEFLMSLFKDNYIPKKYDNAFLKLSEGTQLKEDEIIKSIRFVSKIPTSPNRPSPAGYYEITDREIVISIKDISKKEISATIKHEISHSITLNGITRMQNPNGQNYLLRQNQNDEYNHALEFFTDLLPIRRLQGQELTEYRSSLNLDVKTFLSQRSDLAITAWLRENPLEQYELLQFYNYARLNQNNAQIVEIEAQVKLKAGRENAQQAIVNLLTQADKLLRDGELFVQKFFERRATPEFHQLLQQYQIVP